MKKKDSTLGAVYGFVAYVLWGLFPAYWKQLESVDALQILAHRILWASVFSVLLVAATGKAAALREVFRSGRKLGAAALSGLLVTVNWGTYIWAVNSGNIVESSVGYFLSPLMTVLVGTTFLKEKIDRGLAVSLGIALVGVCVLTADYGRIPWIALALASSWTVYSFIKKRASLDPLPGFALETLSVAPLAAAFLVFLHRAGRGAFLNDGALTTTLLVFAGPVTALPLLSFAAGVTRIPLSRMAPLQYVSPTLQLLLGVLVFGEPFGGTRAAAFACIAAALAVFLLTRRGAPPAETGRTPENGRAAR